MSCTCLHSQHKIEFAAALARRRRAGERAFQALEAVIAVPEANALLPWLLERLPEGMDPSALALLIHRYQIPFSVSDMGKTDSFRFDLNGIKGDRSCPSVPTSSTSQYASHQHDPLLVQLLEIIDDKKALRDRLRAAMKLCWSGKMATVVRTILLKVSTSCKIHRSKRHVQN